MKNKDQYSNDKKAKAKEFILSLFSDFFNGSISQIEFNRELLSNKKDFPQDFYIILKDFVILN